MPEVIDTVSGEAAKAELEYEGKLSELDKEDSFYVIFLEVLGVLFIVISVILLIMNAQKYYPQVLFFDIAGIAMIMLGDNRRRKDEKVIGKDENERELRGKIRRAERDYQQ